MSQPLIEDTAPDVRTLITEDDTPVDNLPSEKQQRLLTEPLYSSWAGPGEGRPFLAAANVGVFYVARNPAIVPDMFLSLDVEVAAEWWRKEHRSYYLWEFGKPPELAIEIVSNTVGGEDGEKKKKYARMHVTYYVIYDPQRQVMAEAVTVYQLEGFAYEQQASAEFPVLKLGLRLWDGVFEGKESTWLRWTDEHGEIIPTGRERAEEERQRAQEERQRAQEERQRAEEERQRAQEERQRAQHEHQRAEQQRERAEQERARAEQEHQRAEEERERAEEERERAEQAKQGEAAQRQRAEQAEQLLEQERARLERLAALLRGLGRDPDQL